MQVLVIGFGSIGARHARILKGMGHHVSVVSQHGTPEYPCYTELNLALQQQQFEYVVVANRTHQHYDTLSKLAEFNFTGRIMVEKPLFHTKLCLPQNSFKDVFVAYNLRFHPLLQRLQSLLEGQKIITAHAYAGQYLPDWRPEQNYLQGYSILKAEGGGVLRDLSHELDYLNWILGGWLGVVAMGGHFSDLSGDSSDAFGLLVTMKKCPLTMIHLNYLDRVLRREVIINTNAHTYSLDFVHGSLRVDEQIETCTVERDYTYQAEHFAAINGTHASLCSISQGMDVVELIQGAEESMMIQGWVKR